MVGQLYARRRSAPRPRLHDLLHGHQSRRLRRADRDRLARERDHRHAACMQNYKRRVRRDRHRHGALATSGSGSDAASSARSAARRRTRRAEDDARRDRRLRDRRADHLLLSRASARTGWRGCSARCSSCVAVAADRRRHARRQRHSATSVIAMLDDLRVQRAVLDVLRAGRQLVQLPRREHREPQLRQLGVPDRLVPVGQSARDHRRSRRSSR